MLKDENRIFKNLYGDESYDLSSALKRGDWKDTNQIIAKGNVGIPQYRDGKFIMMERLK